MNQKIKEIEAKLREDFKISPDDANFYKPE